MTIDSVLTNDTDATIRFAIGTCWLGSILVAVSNTGVCAIFLGDRRNALVHELCARFPNARPAMEGNGLEGRLAKVGAFVEAPAQGLDLPLDLRGTPFQVRVWEALREIPAGSTTSYGDIAKLIGAPNAAVDVGEACASNIIAVAVPCHRVVRKDGTLAGYRWGVARKRALLDREATGSRSTRSRPHQLELTPFDPGELALSR